MIGVRDTRPPTFTSAGVRPLKCTAIRGRQINRRSAKSRYRTKTRLRDRVCTVCISETYCGGWDGGDPFSQLLIVVDRSIHIIVKSTPKLVLVSIFGGWDLHGSCNGHVQATTAAKYNNNKMLLSNYQTLCWDAWNLISTLHCQTQSFKSVLKTHIRCHFICIIYSEKSPKSKHIFLAN